MEKTIRKNLAETIRTHRNERGWSQKELAEQVGMSQSGIAKTELQKNRIPFDTVAQIAHALDIPWDEFHPRKLLEDEGIEDAFDNFKNVADGLFEKTAISSGEKAKYQQSLAQLSLALGGIKDDEVVLEGGDTAGDIWEYIEEVDELLDV